MLFKTDSLSNSDFFLSKPETYYYTYIKTGNNARLTY